jgi:hypothetical protein
VPKLREKNNNSLSAAGQIRRNNGADAGVSDTGDKKQNSVKAANTDYLYATATHADI